MARGKGSGRCDECCPSEVLVMVGGMCLFMSALTFGLVFGLWAKKEIDTISFDQGKCLIISKRENIQICNKTRCSRAELTVDLTLKTGACCVRTTAFDTVTGRFSSGSKQGFLDKFRIGETYPCWYDPDDTATVILERKFPYAAVIISAILGVWLLCSFCFCCAGVFGQFCDMDDMSSCCDAVCPCWDEYEGCICPDCGVSGPSSTGRTTAATTAGATAGSSRIWMDSLESSSDEYEPVKPPPAFSPSAPAEPLPAYGNYGTPAGSLPPPPAYDEVI